MNKTITGKILTISPDMGIIKRMADIHHISLFTGASGFVRGITSRYMRLQEPQLLTTLLFRQWGAGHNVLNSYHAYFAPRLNFTLLQWHPGRAGSTGRLLPSLRHQSLIRRTTPEPILRSLFSRFGAPSSEPTSIHGIGWTATEPIVRRLFSRSGKIEIRQRTQYAVSRQASYHRTMKEAAEPAVESAYLPVRRIVHRARASEPERSEYQSEDNSVVQDMRKKQKEAQKMQSPAIPSMDVNRLTEQVIREIDRRIASQRERMGRP